jgi:hypothetical protein
VWVESENNWDTFDLRNLVKTLVQNELAMIGYLKGYAYVFQMTRALNQSRGIDYVFGIDIPCLAQRGISTDMNEALSKLQGKTVGPNGVFLFRCFNDLVSSMKHADDTGFYCYRAIDSLRHHCAAPPRTVLESMAPQAALTRAFFFPVALAGGGRGLASAPWPV